MNINQIIRFSAILLISIVCVQSTELSDRITLTLFVHDASMTGDWIKGVRVTGWDAEGKNFEDNTDEEGKVIIIGKSGLWNFTISKDGYAPESWDANITKSKRMDAFFTERSNPIDQVTLTLYVTDSVNGTLLEGVRVSGWDKGGTSFDINTDSEGKVKITGKPGLWNFTISKEEYEPVTWDQGVITDGDKKHAHFLTRKAPKVP